MTTTTVTSALTFRKNQRTGEWNAFGSVEEFNKFLVVPVASFEYSDFVPVAKRDGSTSVFEVTGFSKPFDIDGVAHVYGYGK